MLFEEENPQTSVEAESWGKYVDPTVDKRSNGKQLLGGELLLLNT